MWASCLHVALACSAATPEVSEQCRAVIVTSAPSWLRPQTPETAHPGGQSASAWRTRLHHGQPVILSTELLN